MVQKLRDFAKTSLDEDERALFAVLLAPGVAQAYVEDDVSGYAMTEWSPAALPESLAEALRDEGIRVVGLDE